MKACHCPSCPPSGLGSRWCSLSLGFAGGHSELPVLAFGLRLRCFRPGVSYCCMSLVFEADRRHMERTVDDCRYTDRKCQQHLNLSCAVGDGLPALRCPVRPSMWQYFVVAC